MSAALHRVNVQTRNVCKVVRYLFHPSKVHLCSFFSYLREFSYFQYSSSLETCVINMYLWIFMNVALNSKKRRRDFKRLTDISSKIDTFILRLYVNLLTRRFDRNTFINKRIVLDFFLPKYVTVESSKNRKFKSFDKEDALSFWSTSIDSSSRKSFVRDKMLCRWRGGCYANSIHFALAVAIDRNMLARSIFARCYIASARFL